MSRRAVLADRDLIQSLHAAASRCFVILKTCTPAHSSPRRQRKNVSVQIPLRGEKRDKQINELSTLVSSGAYPESKKIHRRINTHFHKQRGRHVYKSAADSDWSFACVLTQQPTPSLARFQSFFKADHRVVNSYEEDHSLHS